FVFHKGIARRFPNIEDIWTVPELVPSVYRKTITCLSYNTDAVEMVRQLVVPVRHDPEATTAAEMDAHDARFYCQDCPKWDKLASS
ncbi:hypothetical protein FRB98_008766, partial [Tulasnella sp. 332]